MNYGLLPRREPRNLRITSMPDLAGQISGRSTILRKATPPDQKATQSVSSSTSLLVFHPNPDDYTARGQDSFKTLRNRIGSEIRTPLPGDIGNAHGDQRQEEWTLTLRRTETIIPA